MKWKGRAGSSNVEDRRGKGGGKAIAGVGGGIGLIIVIIITLLGGNPDDLIGNLGTTDQSSSVPYEQSEQEKELSEFVSVVLADTEKVWEEIFKENGMEYL